MNSEDHCMGGLKDALRRFKKGTALLACPSVKVICAAAHSPFSMKNYARVHRRVEFF